MLDCESESLAKARKRSLLCLGDRQPEARRRFGKDRQERKCFLGSLVRYVREPVTDRAPICRRRPSSV